jgi:hypothetical protein
MIKIGTICYIRHPHKCYGRTCEVISRLEKIRDDYDVMVDGYAVKLADGAKHYPDDPTCSIGVPPELLVPISDPDADLSRDGNLWEPELYPSAEEQQRRLLQIARNAWIAKQIRDRL